MRDVDCPMDVDVSLGPQDERPLVLLDFMAGQYALDIARPGVVSLIRLE